MKICHKLLLLVCCFLSIFDIPKTYATKPNIVIYLADDLGVGEVNQHAPEYAVYDVPFDTTIHPNKIISTPHLERLARNGMRLMRSYTASPVCGPARYSLMTGIPPGNSRMRGNNVLGLQTDFPLTNEATLPSLLKENGYTTYHAGKWGLGESWSIGAPWKQGFDFFYGFTTHAEAHRVFPTSLWESQGSRYDTVSIPENVGASLSTCVCKYENTCLLDPHTNEYTMSPTCKNSNQLFRERVYNWITEHVQTKTNPFFVYWASITPHNGYYDPESDPAPRFLTSPVSTFGLYEDLLNMGASDGRAGHAASITHELDADIGVLLNLLSNLGIEQNTVVIFLSDNGPHSSLGSDKRYTPAYFAATMGLRGEKREVYEGGIRSPTMVYWPGKIQAGSVSFVENAGFDVPLTVAGLIGIPEDDASLDAFRLLGAKSIHKDLLGIAGGSDRRDGLHIEICTSQYANPSKGCDYAFFDLRNPARVLKLVRVDYDFEMFDLTSDPFETTNLAVLEKETMLEVISFFDAGGYRSDYCSMVSRECILPTPFPTLHPTQSPTTAAPTLSPTTAEPTKSPTTAAPTVRPTRSPTTASPTRSPTTPAPTRNPSSFPLPTVSPSRSPTKRPTTSPTAFPTLFPTSPPPTVHPTSSVDNLASASQVGQQCEIEGRVATYSNDVPKSCLVYCFLHPTCIYFQIRSSARKCDLFSYCRAIEASNDVALYDIRVALTLNYERSGTSCSTTRGRLRVISPVSNLLDCARLCSTVPTCKYISYVQRYDSCSLHSSCSTVRSSGKVIADMNQILFNPTTVGPGEPDGPPPPPPPGDTSTSSPTSRPTPTLRPTRQPKTSRPTKSPTTRPTRRPTKAPTTRPTRRPTKTPTSRPTRPPKTSRPTKSPTHRPTRR